MPDKQDWIVHENYVLKDALSLLNCFRLENGSWLDSLYLTAICSLATIATGGSIRPETSEWLSERLNEARNMTTRELLKDKYLVLGIFLGTNVVLKRSSSFLVKIKPLLEKLIASLEIVNWNNDPEFPATMLYALAEVDLNLNSAKRYLVMNVELFWSKGRRDSAIYSFLGLLSFAEGRIVVAKVLRNIGFFEAPHKSLSRLDLRSVAILLLTVSEIEDKYRYVLYNALEQNLRGEFLQVRDTILSVLFHQLNKTVLREKSILAGKNDAVNSIRHGSQIPGIVTVEVPLNVARKLFERPHLSDIALSIMAIKGATLGSLYSLDKKTFEAKCKPALSPSKYINVERLHLLGFLIYTFLGVIAVIALSQIMSNNLIISFLAAVFLLLFPITIARKYFSRLVSDRLERNADKEEG